MAGAFFKSLAFSASFFARSAAFLTSHRATSSCPMCRLSFRSHRRRFLPSWVRSLVSDRGRCLSERLEDRLFRRSFPACRRSDRASPRPSMGQARADRGPCLRPWSLRHRSAACRYRAGRTESDPAGRFCQGHWHRVWPWACSVLGYSSDRASSLRLSIHSCRCRHLFLDCPFAVAIDPWRPAYSDRVYPAGLTASSRLADLRLCRSPSVARNRLAWRRVWRRRTCRCRPCSRQAVRHPLAATSFRRDWRRLRVSHRAWLRPDSAGHRRLLLIGLGRVWLACALVIRVRLRLGVVVLRLV